MAWPTTTNPRTEFVTLRLTVDEAADLDWLQAQTSARSRSEALRTAFERVVKAERKRARGSAASKKRKPGPGMVDPGHESDDE